MSNENKQVNRLEIQGEAYHREEFAAKYVSGMGALCTILIGLFLSMILFVVGLVISSGGSSTAAVVFGVILAIIGGILAFMVFPIAFAGLKVIKPNEALVLTLFGKYVGTLKGEGFYFVNPFVSAVAPPKSVAKKSADTEQNSNVTANGMQVNGFESLKKKLSLKVMTLSNEKQKINDQLGNPIIIGIVVFWKVVNTAKATFNVDDYVEFLSTQCDSALRNIVRLYPYDTAGSGDNEKTLRGSSQEIADNLKMEIQQKVDIAGLEIQEARITHLSYAPEIAAAMLQRQQASAIIDARQMIVEGAVGMVEMALEKLNENDIVQLDEERKAAMVSNLLVVLCGNKDAQPIVNSGSIY